MKQRTVALLKEPRARPKGNQKSWIDALRSQPGAPGVKMLFKMVLSVAIFTKTKHRYHFITGPMKIGQVMK